MRSTVRCEFCKDWKQSHPMSVEKFQTWKLHFYFYPENPKVCTLNTDWTVSKPVGHFLDRCGKT